MPRQIPSGGEEGLREYLLYERAEFRDCYGMALAGAWDALTKPIDVLAGRERYRLHGYELPEGHPALAEYGPEAHLVLTEDNRLMSLSDYLDGKLSAFSAQGG